MKGNELHLFEADDVEAPFPRPTDAEFQFEFSYFYKGKWSKEHEKYFASIAIEELKRNVVFRPWVNPVSHSEGQGFEIKFEIQDEAKVVQVTIRGDYL